MVQIVNHVCMYCHNYLSTCLSTEPASCFNLHVLCMSIIKTKELQRILIFIIPRYASATEDHKQKYLIIHQVSAKSQRRFKRLWVLS